MRNILHGSLSLTAQVMKNVFHQSFNAYKTDIEPRLNDVTLHSLQCSRRLFEIQLSHRRVSAAYIEGDNVAVTVEGEAARVLNFDTGKQAWSALFETGGDIWPHLVPSFQSLKDCFKETHNTKHL